VIWLFVIMICVVMSEKFGKVHNCDRNFCHCDIILMIVIVIFLIVIWVMMMMICVIVFCVIRIYLIVIFILRIELIMGVSDYDLCAWECGSCELDNYHGNL
jgi:hypothetical protein